MNILENRKRAYAFFQIADKNTININRNNVEIPNNINPNNDKKVIVGKIKETVSFFKEDIDNIKEAFDIEDTILLSIVSEFNYTISDFFDKKLLEINNSDKELDNNLDKIDQAVSNLNSNKKIIFNKENFLKLILDNFKTFFIQDENLTKSGYIELKYLIDFYIQENLTLNYEDFIKILTNKSDDFDTFLAFEKDFFLYDNKPCLKLTKDFFELIKKKEELKIKEESSKW